MKTATIRDLRNSFTRVSRWIEAGETVEVTKRGKVFARLLPATPVKGKGAPKPDILARMKADFGELIVSDAAYEELMQEARGSHVERLS